MENNETPNMAEARSIIERMGLYNHETLNAKNPEGVVVEQQLRFRTLTPYFGVQVLYSQRTENSVGEKVEDSYVTVELIQMTGGQPQTHPYLNMSMLAALDMMYLKLTVEGAIAQADKFTNTYKQIAFSQQAPLRVPQLGNKFTKRR